MKKAITLLLAVLMLLGMATTAFAAPRYTEDGNGFTIVYDDGSTLRYNARGDMYTYTIPGYGSFEMNEEEMLDFFDLFDFLLTESLWQESNTGVKKQQSKYSKYENATINEVYWSDTYDSLIAVWDADYRSSANYSVALYRGNTKITAKASDGGKRIDFSEAIAKEGRTGNYHFVVKAKWPGKYTDQEESESYYVDADMLKAIQRSYGVASSAQTAASAQVTSTVGPISPVLTADGWQQQTDGTWKYLSGGVYAANGWYTIGGKWYCFDPNGTLRTNQWIQNTTNASIWYYVGPQGEMVKNQYVGQWYINANGEYYAA